MPYQETVENYLRVALIRGPVIPLPSNKWPGLQIRMLWQAGWNRESTRPLQCESIVRGFCFSRAMS